MIALYEGVLTVPAAGDPPGAASVFATGELRLSCVGDALVAVGPTLNAGKGCGVLRGVRARRPDLVIVLATADTRENVRRLPAYPFDEVTWLPLRRDGIPAAVRRVRARPGRARLARALWRVARLPAVLRYRLAEACRAGAPPASSADLFAAWPMSRSSAYASWDLAFPGGPAPLDFVHWLQLLAAVELRHPGSSWEAVAGRLGTSRSTLARIAHEAAAQTLSALEREGARALAVRFAARLGGANGGGTTRTPDARRGPRRPGTGPAPRAGSPPHRPRAGAAAAALSAAAIPAAR